MISLDIVSAIRGALPGVRVSMDEVDALRHSPCVIVTGYKSSDKRAVTLRVTSATRDALDFCVDAATEVLAALSYDRLSMEESRELKGYGAKLTFESAFDENNAAAEDDAAILSIVSATMARVIENTETAYQLSEYVRVGTPRSFETERSGKLIPIYSDEGGDEYIEEAGETKAKLTLMSVDLEALATLGLFTRNTLTGAFEVAGCGLEYSLKVYAKTAKGSLMSVRYSLFAVSDVRLAAIRSKDSALWEIVGTVGKPLKEGIAMKEFEGV